MKSCPLFPSSAEHLEEGLRFHARILLRQELIHPDNLKHNIAIMSGAGMASAKADMPRGMLAVIQGQNEKAAEEAEKDNKQPQKKEDGPVKAMTKEEQVWW